MRVWHSAWSRWVRANKAKPRKTETSCGKKLSANVPLPIYNARIMRIDPIFVSVNVKLLTKVYDEALNEFFSGVALGCVPSPVQYTAVSADTTAMWMRRIQSEPGTVWPATVSQMQNERRHLETAG